MAFVRAARLTARSIHSSSRVLADDAAASAARTELRLRLAVPSGTLVDGAEVSRVTLPGRAGTYGVEKNAPPLVSELRPGVVVVDYIDGRSDKFFVPGGFAMTHKNNMLDISTPEGVRLEDVEPERIRELNAQAQAKRDSSAAGSKDYAEAVIALEVFKELAKAVGASL